MGIVPIWGLQMIVAVSLAFLFKLNKAFVLLAANISIPPLIPLILYLSHETGKMWLGKEAQDISFAKGVTLELINRNFIQYIMGAITLAIIAGVIFGLLTYLSLKIFKGRKRR